MALASEFAVSPDKVEITRRLLGSSAIPLPNTSNRDISITLDLAGFVRRLLLFDTYILYSVRLKEIPELVRHFGLEGTLAMLSSGALEIRCECAQFVEGALNTPPSPLLTFQFHVVDAHIWEQYLIDCLPVLTRIPITARERMSLQRAVVNALKRSDTKAVFADSAAPAFEGEILSNRRLVKSTIGLVLGRLHGISLAEEFEVEVHKEDADRYRVVTNLGDKIRLEDQQIHEVVKRALLGIAGLYQRIGEMNAHVAIAGFTEDELVLFQDKFQQLAGVLGSHNNEERFTRVVTIAGFAEQYPEDQKIDIDKILSIRTSPEALEFRSWLTDVDSLQDSEIHDRIASLNSKIGLAAQTRTGKAIRLLATTLAGVWPPAGIALSTIDQFLWDKFFRRSGAAAFINELYPSIFPK